VKATNDLLVVRSDAYVLTDDARVVVSPARSLDGLPLVELDGDYFKLLRDFDARFPGGAPSLVECERLVVEGDVLFGSGVKVRGTVTVSQEGEEQRLIEDGALLEG
jgi:UTP--glucose-1-phosphate uridylyltransferase